MAVVVISTVLHLHPLLPNLTTKQRFQITACHSQLQLPSFDHLSPCLGSAYLEITTFSYFDPFFNCWRPAQIGYRSVPPVHHCTGVDTVVILPSLRCRQNTTSFRTSISRRRCQNTCPSDTVVGNDASQEDITVLSKDSCQPTWKSF